MTRAQKSIRFHGARRRKPKPRSPKEPILSRNAPRAGFVSPIWNARCSIPLRMHQATLIAGDGIGPEIAEATIAAVEATGARIRWEIAAAGAGALKTNGEALPPATLASIERTGVVLKGPLAKPAGAQRSVND